MGGRGNQILRRIPRIQFPSRKFKSTATGSASQTEALTKNDETHHIFTPSSEVPAAVVNTAVGGKASLQPKRTPVSDKEIESIMLGGIF